MEDHVEIWGKSLLPAFSRLKWRGHSRLQSNCPKEVSGLRQLVSFLLVLCFLLANALVPASAQDRQLSRQSDDQSGQTRLALVIGNGAYRKASQLDNPVNDANDIAAALEAVGFEVIKGTDQDLAGMRRLIRQFGQKLGTQKGVALFYYAGHGVEFKGRNFLIPVDADIASEVETEDYAIDVDSVLRQMDAAQNGFNIVVLDACRNNPFARGWSRSGDAGGLANVLAPTGTYIAYAAAPGTTALDGKGTRNGVFTGALLKNLKRPGLKLEEVFKATREEVMTLTANKQVPWDSSSLKGDFYFRPPTVSGNVSTEPVKAIDPLEQQELNAWELVKGSNNPDDLNFFLRKFPNGANAAKARARLESIAWQVVRESNDPAKIKAFLAQFPDGENAAAARELAAKMERPAGALLKVVLPGGNETSFSYIPEGEFRMGADNGGADEKPVHTVKITRSFWMQTTEVTQAQWKAVMGTEPSEVTNCPACPVNRVSWDDAQQFIARVNAGNEGHKYRLPTEAEWEYAARAGTTGDYAGDLESMAWFWQNSGDYRLSGAWDYSKIKPANIRARPVGTKQPNAWGLFDMHGNVPEWVQDWYAEDYYSKSPASDPTGPPSGTFRVFRGGSWSSPESRLRSSQRSAAVPNAGGAVQMGFRLVREE